MIHVGPTTLELALDNIPLGSIVVDAGEDGPVAAWVKPPIGLAYIIYSDGSVEEVRYSS